MCRVNFGGKRENALYCNMKLPSLQLNEAYYYHGKLPELKEHLGAFDERVCTEVNDNRYQLKSSMSVGVFRSNITGIIKGIEVDMCLHEVDTDTQKVSFTTGLRVEYYFISVILVVMMVAALFTKPARLDVFFTLLVVWPLSILFFRAIYAAQEKAMVGFIVKELQLEKK